MKIKISYILVILAVFTFCFVNTSQAGDDEWRRFGEAAAILWGVRALTGWDPVGDIVDYPRRRLARERKVIYQKPTNVIVQYPPKSDRISAYPPGYSSGPDKYSRHSPAAKDYYSSDDDYLEPPTQNAPRKYSGDRDKAFEDDAPFPDKDDIKPSILLSTRTEGNYEVETKKIWVAPHWEKKIIEGHWRGDTWVDTHTEKKWVEGEWQVIEDRKPLSVHPEDAGR